ncbi:uncharacterized protein PG986_014466 [Apiospora aurea]|uniref:Uncharacterized protein n=1 Tax=Apiospora aurea TaxID=335848 RepID=A0ABR1PTE7_9PEZI
MGTSGLWSYCNRGRLTSPPFAVIRDKLVDILALEIPRDPDEFQAWLAQKRSDLDMLQKQLEKAWLVLPTVSHAPELLGELTGSEDLYLAPGYDNSMASPVSAAHQPPSQMALRGGQPCF